MTAVGAPGLSRGVKVGDRGRGGRSTLKWIHFQAATTDGAVLAVLATTRIFRWHPAQSPLARPSRSANADRVYGNVLACGEALLEVQTRPLREP